MPPSTPPPAQLFKEGLALHTAGKLAEAKVLYERILTADPHHFDATHMLGVLALVSRHYGPAVSLLKRATTLKPQSPDAFYNLGLALDGAGNAADAISAYNTALALHPTHAKALNNRSKSERSLGLIEASLASASRALDIDPNYSEAQLNTSMALLMLGRFDEGWPLYESRWQSRANSMASRTFAQPLWLGKEPLSGKRILIHAEQGLGDNIQMARYVPLLAQRGATVIIEVARPLAKLMQSLAGVSAIVPRGSPLPDFDLHCPVMSLPYAFGTTLETIPTAVPYLSSTAALRAQWSARLGNIQRPRIGLMWSGGDNPLMPNRSLALSHFADLITNLPFDWISLQKDIRESDRPALAALPVLRHFGDEQDGLHDAAAICELVDLVITVDTSIAHLAGALGRPTWVLLPYVADWRWLMHRKDSPWYPTARLFRQTSDGDWGSVLKPMQNLLPLWV